MIDSQGTLSGKCLLITRADAFRGPVLCEVFAGHGAAVIGDTSDLSIPEGPGKAVAAAGRVNSWWPT